jgi:HK97 family phage major capsid protein
MEALGNRPRGTETQAENKAHQQFGELLRTGEMKDRQIGVDANGGAMVPELIATPIIERALAQSRLASIVKNSVSPTSDYVRLLNLRGQAAAWTAETGTRSDTANFQLREIRPTHGELYSRFRIAGTGGCRVAICYR